MGSYHYLHNFSFSGLLVNLSCSCSCSFISYELPKLVLFYTKIDKRRIHMYVKFGMLS